MAHLVGALSGVRSLAFSSPGIGYSRYVVKTQLLQQQLFSACRVSRDVCAALLLQREIPGACGRVRRTTYNSPLF